MLIADSRPCGALIAVNGFPPERAIAKAGAGMTALFGAH
jgi:hypothetical protein